MATVKFVKTVQYNGVRYPAHSPFQVADEDVASLITQGAILLSAPEKPLITVTEEVDDDLEEEVELEEEVDEVDDVKPIENMTVAELREYAEKKGIELKGADKKVDIFNTIMESELSEGINE